MKNRFQRTIAMAIALIVTVAAGPCGRSLESRADYWSLSTWIKLVAVPFSFLGFSFLCFISKRNDVLQNSADRVHFALLRRLVLEVDGFPKRHRMKSLVDLVR